MTVHVFPTRQPLARDRDVARARTDRLELWLIASLIAATAMQAALFAWFWLG